MLANILGAIAGGKFAGRNNNLSGALVGAALPVIARRGLATLGVALAAGWAAKQLISRKRSSRASTRGARRDARA